MQTRLWKSRRLDLNEVRDPAFREFLAGLCWSLATSIQDFVDEIDQAIPRQPSNGRAVFVQAAPEEKDLRVQVIKALEKLGVYVVPRSFNHIDLRGLTYRRSINEYVEQLIANSDAMVLLHGSCPLGWLDLQMMDLFLMQTERQGLVKQAAVVDKPKEPPLDPEALGVPIL